MSIKNSDQETRKNQNLSTAHQEKEKDKQILRELSGSSHEESCLSMIQSTCDAFPNNVPKNIAFSVTSQMLQEIAPNDPIEGMLCSQIIALNAQGMKYLSRAESHENLLCHTESAVNMAVKLLRLKNETIETLLRYRRKGEQKVLVQHINISDESKAIIGNISTNMGGGHV